jgi:CPA2 family monovalent cation:H+ antiporter-2
MPWVLAAAEAPPFLAQVAALVIAGAVVAYVAQRAGVVPIVGFLLAGVLIGPNALGLVDDLDLVNAAAEAGVILLLFTIGLEFRLDGLMRIRRLIFAGGGLQVALTTALVTAGLGLLGVDWRTGVFTGFLVALSSTAIVLKLLADRSETEATHGRVSIGLLIFQDLAVVVMVLLVPILGGRAGGLGDIAGALGAAVGIIAAVLLVARRALPPLLERVARTCSPEVFLVTVIAICFGTAYASSLAGLSVSLGAFLAGLVVSESRFSEHALGEILPLQIVFSAVFFVSVGMLLDVSFLVAHLPLVLLGVAAVLAVKALATAASVRALGYRGPMALAVGLMLAQVGEFSFVLERVGAGAGLSPAGLGDDGTQALIATTVLLMVATPWLTQAGTGLLRRPRPRLAVDGDRAEVVPVAGHGDGAGAGPPALSDHVIVAGYGRAARALVPALRQAGLPFVITTLNPDGAAEAAAEGLPVLRGDHTKRHLLERAGIYRARVVVVADDDLAVAHRVAAVATALRPEAHVVVRVDDDDAVDALADSGVDQIVTGPRASAKALAAVIVKKYADDAAPPPRPRPQPGRPRPGVDVFDVVRFGPVDGEGCPHLGLVRAVQPGAAGCEECLRMGQPWVHLRICLTCGHVGCCDSSPGRHASAHAAGAGHPVVRSFEPGETWAWCYEDGLLMAGEEAAPRAPAVPEPEPEPEPQGAA